MLLTRKARTSGKTRKSCSPPNPMRLYRDRIETHEQIYCSIASEMTDVSNYHQPYTVLIYGDSNTWGYDPDTPYRYPVPERWVTRLQQAFKSEDILIVGEGMNGRTTMFSKEIMSNGEYDRNGRVTFAQTLQSHKPLDLIILALGTNDLNQAYRHNSVIHGNGDVVEMVLTGVRTLVSDIRHIGKAVGNFYPVVQQVKGTHVKTEQVQLVPIIPKILILGIPPLKATAMNQSWSFPENIEELARIYNDRLPKVCEELGVHHLDISQSVTVSPTDGIHLRLEDQEPLARVIEKKIREIKESDSV